MFKKVLVLLVTFISLQGYGQKIEINNAEMGGMAEVGTAQGPVSESESGPSSLVTNLIAYFRLDETSGTRNDAVGANNLSSQSGVGYQAGLITNSAYFISNSVQWLYINDNSDLSTESSSYTVNFWVNMFTTNSIQFLCGKSGASGQREWDIVRDVTNRVTFRYATNAISFASAICNASLATNDWYMVTAIFDTNNRDAAIAINGTGWFTNRVAGVNTTATTSQFTIGRQMANNNGYFDGLIDEFGFWKGRCLTEAEVSNLYTNRIGYPFK